MKTGDLHITLHGMDVNMGANKRVTTNGVVNGKGRTMVFMLVLELYHFHDFYFKDNVIFTSAY